jgi:hypothetical protein
MDKMMDLMVATVMGMLVLIALALLGFVIYSGVTGYCS